MVHHQSLAFRTRLSHAENEAPEEDAGLRCSRLLTHSIEADQLICYLLKGIFLFHSGWQETLLVRERLGETGNNPCGWPVTSAFDIKQILADILRCPHNEDKIS